MADALPSALVPRHASLVEAAAARIFPTTATPGASEAGVISYVQRALTDAYPEFVPLYRAGCRALDRHARTRFGLGFLRVDDAQRDSVLADFEASRVPDFPRAAAFFETLRTHTMEGVFGEPSYGGNRGLVGWRIVGFPGHQFGYDDPYIDRVVDIEPVAVERPARSKEAWRGRAS